MSGGYFDYHQYHIEEIANEIEQTLLRQGTLKSKDELYGDPEYYERCPEEKFHHTYPVEVQEKMKEAVKSLRIAHVYAQRVDWFLSGDDGEESFISRLSDELKQLQKKNLK